MNKNLMPKFYKIFRLNDEIKRNDIVSILGNAEDKPQKNVKVIDIQYQPFSMLYHDRARKLCECLEGESVFVNIPFVSLYEVLAKLPDEIKEMKYDNLRVDKYGNISYEEDCGTFYTTRIIARWQLYDKDGEVPLHRQSQETLRALEEILC